MQLVSLHKRFICLGDLIRFQISSDDTQRYFEFRMNVFSGTYVVGSGRALHMVISLDFLKGLQKRSADS
jgi:hypothetical protein